MRTRARLLAVGGVMLALALWFLAGAGTAADDEGSPRPVILKLATELAGGTGLEQVKKEAAAPLKDTEVKDIMELMSLRTAKGHGLGMGTTPGQITPDGIEKKIQALAKTSMTKAQLIQQGPALETAVYVSAAISQAVADKCDVQVKTGDKDPAQWVQWSKDMGEQSLELANAIKSKDPVAVKSAASKLDVTCTACHEPFK